MTVLNQLKPEPVFKFFEQICSIPHGSGNTKPISDFCVRFAKEHHLKYIQDDSNNIIIFKAGTSGYEQSDPVILQGHLDMVCEKEKGYNIDFDKEGLALHCENGYVYAEGTTLGGDDGIAVAYALAILDATDIPHPPLEVIFTTDEETGMFGAAAMDCSSLKARKMLNMDSEEEGYLLVSCAGGVDTICHLPIQYEDKTGVPVTITLGNLTGGHSGVEIHKGRANANQLMGRFLNELKSACDFSLIHIDGGLKSNAIPREAVTQLLVAKDDLKIVQDSISKYQNIFFKEHHVADPVLKLTMETADEAKTAVMDETSKEHVIAALVNMPNGVQRMSLDIKGLVQTSLNLGILKTLANEVSMTFAVRSSVKTEKEATVHQLISLMSVLNGTVTLAGEYPAWEYKEDSSLRTMMAQTYEEMYGSKPVIQALHAGVECGLFAGKMPGLDCVSFGPDILNVHTPQERLSVESTERTWNYLLAILKQLK